MRITTNSSLPPGCIIAFMTPFVLAGLFFVYIGLHQQDSSKGIFPGLFGLVFAGISAGIMASVIAGYLRGKSAAKIRTDNPGEPWKWRPDWIARKVIYKAGGVSVIHWFMAVVFLGFSVPLIFIVPRELAKGNNAAIVAIIFPIAALGLLSWAIHDTIQLFKFGNSVFEMAEPFYKVGGEIRGLIHFPHEFRPEQGIMLTLTNINRQVSGSGDHRSTWENVLAQEETVIPLTQLHYPGNGTGIPVAIRAPAEGKETDPSNPSDAVLWRLEAAAAVVGVDYHAMFEVPVCGRVAAAVAAAPAQPVTQNDGRIDGIPFDGRRYSDPTWSDKLSSRLAGSNPALYKFEPRARGERPADADILVRPSPEGGTEIYAPPARNSANLGGLLVISLLLSLFAFAFWHGSGRTHDIQSQGVGVLIGMVALLPFTFFIRGLFLANRTIIAEGMIRSRGGFFAWGPLHESPLSDVRNTEAKLVMTQNTNPPSLFYDLKLVLRDGEALPIARMVRGRRQLEWLSGELRRAAGLPEQTIPE